MSLIAKAFDEGVKAAIKIFTTKPDIKAVVAGMDAVRKSMTKAASAAAKQASKIKR